MVHTDVIGKLETSYQGYNFYYLTFLDNNNNRMNNSINNNDFLDIKSNWKRSIQKDEDSDDDSDIQTLNIRKEIISKKYKY